MKASARERRHFEAIRTAKTEERATRLSEAVQQHPLVSMREGLALAGGVLDPHVEEALDRRARGQAELARRARALGMRGGRGQPREPA